MRQIRPAAPAILLAMAFQFLPGTPIGQAANASPASAAFRSLAEAPPALTNSVFYRRWKWKHDKRAFPRNSIPDGALERAWRQTLEAKAFAPDTPVPGNAWTAIGPGPIFNGQTSGSTPVSGRVARIAIN